MEMHVWANVAATTQETQGMGINRMFSFCIGVFCGVFLFSRQHVFQVGFGPSAKLHKAKIDSGDDEKLPPDEALSDWSFFPAPARRVIANEFQK